MKRILSMLLAALLMFTLSAAAFADETNDENKSLLEKLGSGELFTGRRDECAVRYTGNHEGNALSVGFHGKSIRRREKL